MNHRVLLQQTISLMLIVLLLTGCGGTLVEPTATPIPTPDHSTLATDKRQDPVGDESPHASVVYTLPEMDQVTLANVEYKDGLTMDVYYPPDFDFTHNLPVVILINGVADGSWERVIGCKFKDTGLQISWAQLVAASGMIAIAYETQAPETDIHDLINFTRANGPWLRVDKDKICLFAVSANPATALIALTDSSAEYRDSLACAVFYYGHTPSLYANDLSADVPLFIVKAGEDSASTNRQLDSFVENAREVNASIEYVEYEDGIHGFDVWQDTDESREIVKQTLEFMKTHLQE